MRKLVWCVIAAGVLVGCKNRHDEDQEKLDRAIERAGGIDRAVHHPSTAGTATGMDTRPGIPEGTPLPGAPEHVALSAEEAKAGCDKRVRSACGQLAVYYSIGLFVDKDRKRARDLAKPGCDARDPLSCYALGALYETDPDHPDDKKALELYDTACSGGAPEGCSELGMVYVSGRTSAGPSAQKALDYLHKACAIGDKNSCLQIGMLQGCVTNPESTDPICRRMNKKQ
ncbi:MAG: hypothetical protein JWO36_1605 [Myxococcales bacterium]|nr:hypothetical protein [Myxococcales bacterium]